MVSSPCLATALQVSHPHITAAVVRPAQFRSSNLLPSLYDGRELKIRGRKFFFTRHANTAKCLAKTLFVQGHLSHLKANKLRAGKMPSSLCMHPLHGFGAALSIVHVLQNQ